MTEWACGYLLQNQEVYEGFRIGEHTWEEIRGPNGADDNGSRWRSLERLNLVESTGNASDSDASAQGQ